MGNSYPPPPKDASATQRGMLNTSSQEIGGPKTFVDPVSAPNVTLEQSNFEWTAGNEEGGAPIAEAYFEPVTRVIEVYLHGNVLASEPWPHETLGSDETGDGTKARPWLSMNGLRRGIGRMAIDGVRVIVNLGGGVPFIPNSTPGSARGDTSRASRRWIHGMTNAHRCASTTCGGFSSAEAKPT